MIQSEATQDSEIHLVTYVNTHIRYHLFMSIP